ncbi:hypothetical protein ES705_26402 [subsurface metagenome]
MKAHGAHMTVMEFPLTAAHINMGIAKDRFASKGFGESVPVASNDTPEGRANHRRVEFVKM